MQPNHYRYSSLKRLSLTTSENTRKGDDDCYVEDDEDMRVIFSQRASLHVGISIARSTEPKTSRLKNDGKMKPENVFSRQYQLRILPNVLTHSIMLISRLTVHPERNYNALEMTYRFCPLDMKGSSPGMEGLT